MKPPRYLLREAVVNRVLDESLPGRFLEIGYGNGQMLVTLARRGLTGAGYDVSSEARERAAHTLESQGIRTVSLLRELEGHGTFDYVLFFEVIGYWLEPARELARLKALLSPQGKLIFSFTNSAQGGAAEKLTGDMRTFSRAEIESLLASSGFVPERIVNYGYPLTNLLKPGLDFFHVLRDRLKLRDADRLEMQKSGLSDRYFTTRIAGALFNPITIQPFVYAQHWFRDSDRGTGYLVVARSA
jgi:SAM-dependent methyltransferase